MDNPSAAPAAGAPKCFVGTLALKEDTAGQPERGASREGNQALSWKPNAKEAHAWTTGAQRQARGHRSA